MKYFLSLAAISFASCACTLLVGCASGKHTGNQSSETLAEPAQFHWHPLAQNRFGQRGDSYSQPSFSGEPIDVLYQTDRRKLFDVWARINQLGVQDERPVNDRSRVAMVFGADATEKLKHQDFCTILTKPRSHHPGKFFVTSKSGAKQLDTLLSDWRLSRDYWGRIAFNGFAGLNPALTLPTDNARHLFMIKVEPHEEAFWMTTLKRRPEVSAVESDIECPWIGQIILKLPIHDRSLSCTLDYMKRKGYFFLADQQALFGANGKLKEGNLAHESLEIVVPIGDEIPTLRDLRGFGANVTLDGVLDGAEVSKVKLKPENLKIEKESVSGISVPEARERISAFIRTSAPQGIQINRLGDSGLWVTGTYFGGWALKNGDDSVGWEQIDVKVMLNQLDSNASGIEIILLVRASSPTGKGTSTIRPVDEVFTPVEKLSAELLQREQQFTRALMGGLRACLESPSPAKPKAP